MNNENNGLIILHDSNGRPYFEAIEHLKNDGIINKVVYRETAVFKKFLRDIIKRRININSARQIYNNFIFRLSVPFIKNYTIIMGCAPYDIKFIWYSLLRFNNNLIIHTSWPYWGTKRIPHRQGVLSPLIKKYWDWVIASENIKIVCVSSATYWSLITTHSAFERAIQIPHAIDREIFKCSHREEDTENKSLKLLYVGRMVPEKGLSTIGRIIDEVSDNLYQFTLVGDGPLAPLFTEKYKNMDNVEIIGYVNNKNELAKLYCKNDILLVPSIRSEIWEELFGIVIIEAMSSGVIPIASNHIGPTEIITDGYNGFLVNENNPGELRLILDSLQNNRSTLNTMSNNAIKTANKYDIKRIAELWKKVIS